MYMDNVQLLLAVMLLQAFVLDFPTESGLLYIMISHFSIILRE